MRTWKSGFLSALDAEKLGLDKNAELSRFDIRYLSVSGKDVLIELKKGDRKLSMEELLTQVRKYFGIMSKMARNVEPLKTPNFEIIVLVGVSPDGFGQEDADALKPYNARLMTYNHLIDHARSSYGEYIQAEKQVEKIQKLVEALG